MYLQYFQQQFDCLCLVSGLDWGKRIDRMMTGYTLTCDKSGDTGIIKSIRFGAIMGLPSRMAKQVLPSKVVGYSGMCYQFIEYQLYPGKLAEWQALITNRLLSDGKDALGRSLYYPSTDSVMCMAPAAPVLTEQLADKLRHATQSALLASTYPTEKLITSMMIQFYKEMIDRVEHKIRDSQRVATENNALFWYQYGMDSVFVAVSYAMQIVAKAYTLFKIEGANIAYAYWRSEVEENSTTRVITNEDALRALFEEKTEPSDDVILNAAANRVARKFLHIIKTHHGVPESLFVLGDDYIPIPCNVLQWRRALETELSNQVTSMWHEQHPEYHDLLDVQQILRDKVDQVTSDAAVRLNELNQHVKDLAFKKGIIMPMDP